MKLRVLIFSILVSTTFAQSDTLQRLTIDYNQPDDVSKYFNQLQAGIIQNGENDFLLIKRDENNLIAQETHNGGNTWNLPYELPVDTSANTTFITKRDFNLFQASDQSLFIYFICDHNKIQISKSSSFDLTFKSQFLSFSTDINYANIAEGPNGNLYLCVGDGDHSDSEDLIIMQSHDNGESWVGLDTLELNNFLFLHGRASLQVDNKSNILVTYSTYNIIDNTSTLELISKNLDNNHPWSKPRVLYSSPSQVVQSVYFVKTSNGKFWIIYESQKGLTRTDFNDTDIFYIVSEDQGNTWSEPEKFTKFVGWDEIYSVTSQGEYPTILFRTARKPNWREKEMYWGLAGKSIDPAPPVVYSFNVDTLPGDSTLITAEIKDDGEIEFAQVNYLKGSVTLSDDGNLYDSLANDNIYSNKIDDSPRNIYDKGQIIKANDIIFPFNNKGDIASSAGYSGSFELIVQDSDSNRVTINEILEFNTQIATYKNKSLLFNAGFILSGYNNEDLWIASETINSFDHVFLPGNIGSTENDPLNRIYSVSRNDPEFGASWNDWKYAVEQGAYFYDGNSDGIYDPVDINQNGSWDANEDKPDILYDETYFSVFNDGVEKDFRLWNINGPMGIEVRQTIFVSNSNSLLKDVVFIRYSILNTGLVSDTLEKVNFSIYTDGDIGEYNDDLIGCDTSLNSSFTYNNPNEDDKEWGNNSPALFISLLQGPIKKSSESDVAFIKFGPNIGELTLPGYKNLRMSSHTTPRNDDAFNPITTEQGIRNLSEGFTSNGIIVDPCNFQFGIVKNSDCTEVNPFYWFSGNPVNQTGWLYKEPYDQTNITTVGPFRLIKNQSQDIIVAYSVGHGSTALSSISAGREKVKYIHEEYQKNFSTIVGVKDEPQEIVKDFSLSQNYPNPFNPNTIIEYQVSSSKKVSLKVYDILGREISTLVNEVKAPGTYEVQFDASYLASGVYFYRLTAGEFVQTRKMMVIK